MLKGYRRYIAAFLTCSLLVVGLLGSLFHSRHLDQLEAHNQLVNVTYKTVLKGFENNAEFFYTNTLNVPRNLSLLQQVYASDSEQKVSELRKKLYERLIGTYGSMSTFRVKQLHFHLRNNDSFLRFHRPQKYGDNLTEVRSTVAYVNRTHQKISGFEEGRIFNGYRFVFPLQLKGEHLGSVEASVSMKVVLDELESELHKRGSFMIRRSVVDRKLFSSERGNYRMTPFSGHFLYESSITPADREDWVGNLIGRLVQGKRLGNFLEPDRTVTYEQSFEGRNYFVTFLPVKNAVSRETVAYIVLGGENDKYIWLWTLFLLSSLFSVFVIGVFIWLFYRVKQNEARLFASRQQIEQQNALLERAQSVAKLGYWTLEVDSGRLYWSDEVYRIFGESPQTFEASYEAFLSYVHPQDRARLQQAYQASVEARRPYSLDHRIIRKDGTVRFVQEVASHTLNQNGEVVSSVGTVLDITDRVESEQHIEKLKEQYLSLVQNLPDIVYRCQHDEHWTMRFINRAVESVTGYSAEDFVHNRVRTFASIIHPEDCPYVEQQVNTAVAKNRHYDLEYRLLDTSGKTIYVKEHGHKVAEEEGVDILEGVVTDVTAQKETLAKLQRYIDTQNQIVVVLSGEVLTFANRSFYQFFGLQDLGAFRKEYDCLCQCFIPQDDFFDLTQVSSERENWVQALQRLPGHRRVVLMKDQLGERHAFSVSVSSLDAESTIISLHDISDTMREQADWKKRASLDALTGAYNRHFLEKYYHQQMQEIAQSGKETGLLLFDIDHFKQINDRYGHNVGDQVLEELAQRVQSMIRDTDSLVRWGGEEFLIVCPIDGLQNLSKLADKIRRRVKQSPLAGKAVTCSFGGTVIAQDEPLKRAVERADEALYYVKTHGRDGIKVQNG